MRTQNAEGIYHFQPRVARAGALPWGSARWICANPERVVIKHHVAQGIRELFPSFIYQRFFVSQGVALGWNLQTPAALRTAPNRRGAKRVK